MGWETFRDSLRLIGIIGLGLFTVLAVTPAHGINGSFKVSQFGEGVQVWFEAEAFDERCPGPRTPDDPDDHPHFPVVDQEGAFTEGELRGAFGKAVNRFRGEGSRLQYTFDIAAAGGEGGEWYFWGRLINPGNRSDYLLVEGDPDDPAIPTGDCDAGGFPGSNEAAFPGGSFSNGDDRIFENNTGSVGPPPVWGWSQPNHEEGHTKLLQNGINNMFMFRREGDAATVFWDVFLWTNDPNYVPTDDDYLAAEVRQDMPPVCDPPDPDTSCLGITVDTPPGNLEGLYTVTVNARDIGGDPIRYSLKADSGVGLPRELLQVDNNVFEVVLGPGTWNISVTVDDDPACDDALPDNTCTHGPIEVVSKGDSDYRVSNIDGGTQIWIQAEKFDERFDELGPDPDPPIEPHAAFPVVVAEGAFGDPAGNAVGRTGVNGMLVYHFDITEAGGFPGTWYHFGRVINPNNDSDYMLVDSDPQDPDVPGGPPFPGGDGAFPFTNGDDRVFEQDTGSFGPPPIWGFHGNEEGHFKVLQEGQNSMYLFRRQGGSVLWDVFVWADDPNYRPRDDHFFLAEPFDRAACNDDADTRCQSFTVAGPPDNEEGIYTVTVNATDDDGDPIIYTLTANDGMDPPTIRRVIRTGNNALPILLTPGIWTLSVSVDDDRICDDVLPEAECTQQETIEVVEAVKDWDFKVSEFGGLGVQIWFEAEDFTERFDEFGPDPDPPIEPHPFFPVIDTQFGSFFQAVERAGGAGGMLRYEFDISRTNGGVGGTWYFWGRVINPGNRSDYLLVQGDLDDPVIPDGPPFPGGNEATFPDPQGGPDSQFTNGDDRIFEENIVGDAIGGWAWARQGHQNGHTKDLQDGVNEMFIFPRESGNGTTFWDVFMWTNDPDYIPTDQDYVDADPMTRDGENCNNTVDDDGDGLADCDDPDCAARPQCQAGQRFIRGNVDAQGSINISDPIFLLSWLFQGGEAPACRESANVDGQGTINISDPIFLLSWLFQGGPAPTAPFPDCGRPEPDPGPDAVDCNAFSLCP